MIEQPKEKVKKMGRKARAPSDLPIDFFASRWISRYIIQSIKKTGDMSEAYELLLQDAHPQPKELSFEKLKQSRKVLRWKKK